MDVGELKTKIESGDMARSEIMKLRENCRKTLNDPSKQKNHDRALQFLEVTESTTVPETRIEYIFMGYCPSGDIANRVDTEWFAGGFCNFNFLESQHQVDRFFEIVPGDIVICKKRETFGETMRIHAWGKVTKLRDSRASNRWLEMNWIVTDDPIIVPLMGCNATVNVRTLEQVEEAMPPEFWEWLEQTS